MKLKIKKTKGFTLVEVVVVLVILAILAAIAVPALTGYIGDAKKRSADTQARNVYQAAQAAYVDYYADNKSSVKDTSNRRFYAWNGGSGWGPATDPGTMNEFTKNVCRYLGDDVTGFIAIWVDDKGKITKTCWSETHHQSPEAAEKDKDAGFYKPR